MDSFVSCLEKQQKLKELFYSCQTKDERYYKIMELGKNLPKLDPAFKLNENLVKGCQSVMYLHATLKDGKVFFEADCDALISLGLAALLVEIYSGETPETILKCAPDCLNELELSALLTPNRANGLYQIHLKMKQEALKLLLKGQGQGLQ